MILNNDILEEDGLDWHQQGWRPGPAVLSVARGEGERETPFNSHKCWHVFRVTVLMNFPLCDAQIYSVIRCFSARIVALINPGRRPRSNQLEFHMWCQIHFGRNPWTADIYMLSKVVCRLWINCITFMSPHACLLRGCHCYQQPSGEGRHLTNRNKKNGAWWGFWIIYLTLV